MDYLTFLLLKVSILLKDMFHVGCKGKFLFMIVPVSHHCFYHLVRNLEKVYHVNCINCIWDYKCAYLPHQVCTLFAFTISFHLKWTRLSLSIALSYHESYKLL